MLYVHSPCKKPNVILNQCERLQDLYRIAQSYETFSAHHWLDDLKVHVPVGAAIADREQYVFSVKDEEPEHIGKSSGDANVDVGWGKALGGGCEVDSQISLRDVVRNGRDKGGVIGIAEGGNVG